MLTYKLSYFKKKAGSRVNFKTQTILKEYTIPWFIHVSTKSNVQTQFKVTFINTTEKREKTHGFQLSKNQDSHGECYIVNWDANWKILEWNCLMTILKEKKNRT